MIEKKTCCKNAVILMPEPVAEPALNGLRLNLRIVSIVMFNFASYLTIGLPLAVLPGYVHDAMGFSAFWAGLIISLQYFATLLSRPHAGRYADVLGPKKIVVFGLCGCFLSGLGYLLADIASAWPMISLLLLGLGRVILGIGQSFAGTGSTLWGVGVVGSLHIGRVISWNGIVTYGAMAMGAPLGVLCYAWGGLQGLALTVMGVALFAILLALPRPSVKANKGKPLPFRAVLGRVWLYGMALALASAGFGVIATFITLFYDAKGWDGAAFALTLFSVAFVGTRLLFPNGINRLGGLNVAMICFGVEIIGLLLVGTAAMPWMAKIGVLLTGMGFSLVFPALGVVAVKAVPPQNQGAALATYTVFMDMSLGVTGPLAGLVMTWAGVPVIYLAAAGLVAMALLLTWRLKKRPPSAQPEAASSS
ncbi:MFS transporter [Salmonella enterica subsp. enterica serovar Adamstua]|uniref:MFS transporter n=1 Tax=Salmonella enterica TaxID=28901 RepID=UPI0009AFD030|nr:MFS transporter [Salmonella enterica]EBS4508346.1 MFS transporter [Salmonella enterica subsp. enterica serovar Adamstua]EBW5409914.1 MFS transporter [Salmonella enterica subsp. enterica serovar Bonn]ECI7964979.1 MFS transporter [Salmonella enterica subsp. enterica]EEG2880457.1 MFS transporter [Salmonella enterica subsp. enterica serovar Nessziona]EAN1701420.1 MFS transporter [Salmonella enterica]